MNTAFHTLVSVDDLLRHGAEPNWVVVDCRFVLSNPAAGEAMYAQGHLPGARYAHLDRDLSGPLTPQAGRHPLPSPQAFLKTLGEWGISPQHQIIAYDQAGGPFAARLWWLARWLGHRNVAVLDGGIAAWQHAGGPLETVPPAIVPCVYKATDDSSRWLTTADVLANLESQQHLLLDARETERFRGITEPIDPVAGHIPAAMNLPFRENLSPDGTFLSTEQLRRRFENIIGERDPESIVHMCGSGVTACHNLLAMEAAGLTGSKLYAGSWSEWIRDPARPVAREQG